ncbi:MAG: DUF177 domain-containing protein [Syntrophomonas sp.]|uniref:YceD family protein n=1 Tax=Syntrophomonas sp. TaxID=2053627 RepID=UPI002618EC46|nr:DUF177 domain-containing protein [Syntrophomonas sp.]MDD2510121.1 DUF177 domain-containing protein [Syntrophomonas sp.]MDD3878524.1 DUF177 domain-containing protein [Syntrophomonas sp.]MDD4626435.1 DUF177 domain-containing protein [Syntrophomonas sp.]
MKIDLRRLKLRPQQSEEFYLETTGRNEFLSEVGGKFAAAVQVDLVVDNTGKIFVARGRVRTTLQLPCSRCLGEAIVPVDAELACNILESKSAEYADLEEDIIIHDPGQVDIDPAVEEAIFMSIPINPLCKLECQGICPQCGVNRNLEDCHCETREIDPRWEKLKNLIRK